jgi:hypothetical protein
LREYILAVVAAIVDVVKRSVHDGGYVCGHD